MTVDCESMTAMPARVFTIPPSAPFLPTLIGALRGGQLGFCVSDGPPALAGLERRLLLTKLVTKWASAPEVHGASGIPLVAQTPAAACALADDLARLLDDMTTRGVPWDKLDGLVPDFLDPYWQLTLKFLRIAREAWPAVLRESGFIEPAQRRDALIKAEAARLARKTDGPVIAAGSTGS